MRISGMKKQEMAAAAERMQAGKGWCLNRFASAPKASH
jgi:hypothetical protein